MLQGRLDAAEVRRAARDRFLRRLVISAWQARLFNLWLTQRLAEGLFATALRGDVLKKLATGGLFTCEDPEAGTARAAAFEISPAGPMFGHKMRPAAGDALAREERLLAEDGMTASDLARGGGESEGTRRAGRIPLALGIEPLDDGYLVEFELPKGSYATVVMRELVKGEIALVEAE
jgi:tRNA pseudouridine13 synthase